MSYRIARILYTLPTRSTFGNFAVWLYSVVLSRWRQSKVFLNIYGKKNNVADEGLLSVILQLNAFELLWYCKFGVTQNVVARHVGVHRNPIWSFLEMYSQFDNIRNHHCSGLSLLGWCTWEIASKLQFNLSATPLKKH